MSSTRSISWLFINEGKNRSMTQCAQGSMWVHWNPIAVSAPEAVDAPSTGGNVFQQAAIPSAPQIGSCGLAIFLTLDTLPCSFDLLRFGSQLATTLN